MKHKWPRCIVCQDLLSEDVDGADAAKCARCVAEENHDFDREPHVTFERNGERVEHERTEYDDELREALGAEPWRVRLYMPENAVTKIRGRWNVKLVSGKYSPITFKTKKAALEAARYHLKIKKAQIAEPWSHTSIHAVRAAKRLMMIKQLMAQGWNEMDAGAEATKRLP